MDIVNGFTVTNKKDGLCFRHWKKMLGINLCREYDLDDERVQGIDGVDGMILKGMIRIGT